MLYYTHINIWAANICYDLDMKRLAVLDSNPSIGQSQ